MAKTEIRFLCQSETNDYLTVKEYSNEILITLSDYIGVKGDVVFDKSTAIKFAKTLRTEINKINS